MKIIQDEGFCTCCGNYSEYNYGDENYSLLAKDLKSYNNYKDIYVYRCPKCGFISTDITGVEGVMYGVVRNSLEYKNAFNCEYLQGLQNESICEDLTKVVPANYYEAYSFVCLAEKDYEKYIRTVAKAIELKEVLIRKYKAEQDEDSLEDDEEIKDYYNEVIDLINKSIQTNRQQIDFYFTQTESKNLFLKLMYLENLAKLNKKEEAQTLFNKLNKNILLKEDLKQYFIDLLK